VPGLVGLQVEVLSLDENLSGTGRHRNLIPANPFNVTTLFEPTVTFIQRASAIAPPGYEDEPKAFGAVLEDFVVQVFLPRLDDKVTAAFRNAVSGKNHGHALTNAKVTTRIN
jgi:exocyst complex component 4